RLGDFALRASAPAAPATNAGPDDDAAAAFASAARAARLAGDDARAEQNARAALKRFPGHRYAVALLEEILRAQGKADDVVALLRSAAEARQGDSAAGVSLLNAGAAAEAAGDSKLAADTYEQAADLDPTNESPLWALARLGAQNDDNQLVLRALEALSALEVQGQGAGHATLALGEHYAVRSSKSELSEAPLEACLDNPELAADAAFALAIQGEAAIDPTLRLRALRLLAKSAPLDAVPLLQDAGITAATGEIAPDAVQELSEELRALDASDPYAVLVSLLNAPAADRADAWLNLANATSGATRDAFTLHGLRSMMASGTDASADAFMIAQELAGSESEFAAIAVDETLEASDDADPRSEALIGRIPLASKATAASLLAGAGRAATAARRNDAVSLLQRAIDAQPEDLVSWEAMRVAARDASNWPKVAEACDHLADALSDGPFYCELVEESAAVRMDYLGDDDGARERLNKLFESEPGRAKAYHRLHDLLAEADDTHGLSLIVASRISTIDDSDELERLFYEQARLHRSHGDLEDALMCLENLSMLNEGHVGGIALAIEINVALEQWDDAVDSLRALASADVPNKQRRIALLGAADFLERKKGDSTAALTELRRIEELGLADNALYVRMADVALRAGQSEEAVRTLLNAADLYQGSERAHILRRAAAVQREDLRDEGGALLSYRQALSIEPTNMESAEAVAALLPPGEMRHAHAGQFAESVREALKTSTVDLAELHKLQRAAEWLDDRVMLEAVIEVIEALGLDETQEQSTTEVQRPMPKRELTPEEILSLRVAPSSGCAELASAAEETLAAMDGLDLGTLGVTRKDAVSKHDRVREVLENACSSYGIPMGEVYRGGSSPLRITAIPGKRDRTDWVVGTKVQGSMSASHIFDVGRQAYAAYAHLRSYASHGSVKSATMLLAACAAAGRPLPSGEGRPGVSEWTRAAEGALSRRGRKNIAAAVAKAQASGETDVEQFLVGAQRSMNRTGLLLSQNLRVALVATLDSEPSTESLLRSADALDIVHTWLSPVFIELRKKLGLK
ncbi:MAG: tetratricopeptide (TPR) repeat protein, partial [Polyangiales bacterium]